VGAAEGTTLRQCSNWRTGIWIMRWPMSERRLTYAPEEPVLLMNVAYLHLRRSGIQQSLDYLEPRASRGSGQSGCAKLVGLGVSYGMTKWMAGGCGAETLPLDDWKRCGSAGRAR